MTVEQLRFRVKSTWGCIVGAGMPGTDSAIATDGNIVGGAPRNFTLPEALAYVAEKRKSPGAYYSIVLVEESAR